MACPKDRRRGHLHYTPTSSFWLNLVERWFKELTDKRLRRVTFTSVTELTEAITDWAGAWFDAAGFENGDECGFVYGPPQGAPGAFFNQVINGHDYLTQEEFSNASFFASGGGCLQHP